MHGYNATNLKNNNDLQLLHRDVCTHDKRFCTYYWDMVFWQEEWYRDLSAWLSFVLVRT